jgi:tripartite ATP-independent transporter DctP family solute receptor
MFRKALIPALAMLGSIGLMQDAGAETLRFAHTLSPTDTHQKAAEYFAEKVKEKTGGTVEFTIHPAGELGKDPAILEGIRLGTIDAGLAGNPFYTRFEPTLNALDLPYLFSGYDHVYKVLDGKVGDDLLAGLDKHRMKGLGFWEIGFRNVTNSVRPIKTPEDLKGLKIRTTPNPAHVRAFELLSAIPTPMAFTEVYLALETGTVDGQENPVGTIKAMKFNEVQKYLSLTKHAYTPSIVAMNKARFDALAPEHQTAILEAAKEAAAYQRKLNRDIEGAALEEMKKAGLEVMEDIDVAPFQKIVTDAVKKDYVDQHGSALVDAIQSAE